MKDKTNCEGACYRCGKVTMFCTIAPYGSRDDGELICAKCIDSNLIEREELENIAWEIKQEFVTHSVSLENWLIVVKMMCKKLGIKVVK